MTKRFWEMLFSSHIGGKYISSSRYDYRCTMRRLEALEKKVEILEKENAILQERLAKYENP